ncbi:MAG: hypothetical protein ABII06_20230, partial [Pseudomonadota bacterium]
MENSGWIKLHRKIMEMSEWLMEPFTKGQAWVDLLLLANHKTGYIQKRGITIEVNRGQVGYSEDALAARWKWSRGKVVRFLVSLVHQHRISKKAVQQNIRLSNLITITNYDWYQSDGTTNGTTNGHQTVQEQEEKEEKEIRPFLSNSDEVRLSELLFEKILSRNPNQKKPNLQTWAKDVDRMIRIDKRTPEELQDVIEWCQADTFWQNNILSTAKLRSKFD